MDIEGEQTNGRTSQLSCMANMQRICAKHWQTVPTKMCGRVGEDGRPRPRCLGHGGHIKSGKQTIEGRKRIAEATSKRMRAFWSDWRARGKPPLLWREALRTARAKRKPVPPPPKPPMRPVVLTEAEREFGRRIGLLK
jgi:hypothetical protein